MKKIKLENTILFALILIGFSCASKKNIEKQTVLKVSNPKLIFLNYDISQTENGKKKIELINKIVADGKLKIKTTDKSGNLGDLICNQLDENSNILQSIVIKNPLLKTFEYIDDSKQFQTKVVKLDHTEFSLKLKLNPNTKHIIIKEFTLSKKNLKSLIKTKI
mgnify:CR=1 FL=1